MLKTLKKLFDKLLLKTLKKLKIDVLLYKRYVDDANIGLKGTPRGLRWIDGKIVQGPADQDHRQVDHRTAELVRCIANTIIPSMIRMEEDYPSNHLEGTLPILDLQVWVSKNRILHSFYKKKVSSRLVVHSRSALMTNQKRSILVAEAVRRMKNCSPSMNWKDKAHHLTMFSLPMYRSGHSHAFRDIVLTKAVSKYVNMMTNHGNGSKVMYRSKEERELEVSEKGGRDRNSNWFGKLGYKAALALPATKEDKLVGIIRKSQKIIKVIRLTV